MIFMEEIWTELSEVINYTETSEQWMQSLSRCCPMLLADGVSKICQISVLKNNNVCKTVIEL